MHIKIEILLLHYSRSLFQTRFYLSPVGEGWGEENKNNHLYPPHPNLLPQGRRGRYLCRCLCLCIHGVLPPASCSSKAPAFGALLHAIHGVMQYFIHAIVGNYHVSCNKCCVYLIAAPGVELVLIKSDWSDRSSGLLRASSSTASWP